MKDGHLNKCKCCTKSDVVEHRANNESVREYDRKRGCRQTKESLRQYREDNPKKYAAHLHVRRLVHSGKLLKPTTCSECGSCGITSKGIHGHHDDYDKPDVVRWLCAKCHHRWHSKHGEALNPN